MPQEPKRRHSRERKGKRRAAIHLSLPKLIPCPNCKSMISQHAICPNCGFYKGKEILNKRNEKPSRSAA